MCAGGAAPLAPPETWEDSQYPGLSPVPVEPKSILKQKTLILGQAEADLEVEEMLRGDHEEGLDRGEHHGEEEERTIDPVVELPETGEVKKGEEQKTPEPPPEPTDEPTAEQGARRVETLPQDVRSEDEEGRGTFKVR